MFELKVISRFAAAHQLKMVGEKCENLHGHNWKIEVFIQGKELEKSGVLYDFGQIKKHLSATLGLIDHKFLNELPWFGDSTPPSSENIARFVAEELQKRIEHPGLKISKVIAWESDDAAAAYIPG